MKKHLVSLLVLFLMVASSLVGVSNPQKREFSSKDDIIWDNYGYSSASVGYASQLDNIYPLNCQTSDDFILNSDMLVTGVHWWGWFSGDPPGPNPIDFNIIFYSDDGTGMEPTGAGMYDPTSTALSVYQLPLVNGTPTRKLPRK